MRILTLISLLVVGCVVHGLGQKQKPVRKKTPVIRAIVTVKGDGNYKPPDYVDENSAGSWNEFEMPEHKLRILAPAKKDDFGYEKTSLGDGAVWEYSTYTKNGQYLLMIRDFGGPVPVRNAAHVLDEMIDKFFYPADPKFKVVSRRNLTILGAAARELIIHAGDTVKKSRVFLANGKLFALSVSFEPRTLWPANEKWADKFLDSFDLDITPINEG